MTTIIEIDGTKCKRCYSCVRQCPVKAIKVEDNQALIVDDRCINCGYCLDACARNAREAKSYRYQIKGWNQQEKELIACVAPSFIASFVDCEPGQVVTALHKLGFDQVYKVALGAQLTAQKYDEYLINTKRRNLISTACPTIVNLIEKHYPQLIDNLIPLVSPMVALGKLIKAEKPDSKVVFIGPCIAKKGEIEIKGLKGVIDAVLTFKELKEIYREEGITELKKLNSNEFSQIYLPQKSDDFALSGGLTSNLNNISSDEMLITEGSYNCQELISGVLEDKIEAKLLDILFCRGCIDGPRIDSELSLFARQKKVAEYSKENKTTNSDNKKQQSIEQEKLLKEVENLDLGCEFENFSYQEKLPTEGKIKEILAYTNKVNSSDELNCGACGYETCREKAVAVYQELAEVEMCLPYLLEQAREEADYYKDKLAQDSQTKYLFKDIKGKSVEMKEAKVKAQQAAQTKSTILILGESGTGKEMFAHAIHNASQRRDEPFIKINCAAITESLLESELFGYEEGAFTGAKRGGKPGKFELADGGTIFLDEVGDMPLQMQAKLLRVLQEGEIERVGGNKTITIDLRVIAATNRDLKQMVKDGDFREDLYYRLNVITIKTPALRSRIEDLPGIIDHIINKLTVEQRMPRKSFSKEALNRLMQHDWPGNVRELENVIVQTFSLTYEEMIEVEHLPNYLLQGENQASPLIREGEVKSLAQLTSQVEKQAIKKALEATNWNKKQTAELLQISRSTLYQKIDKYNI
ncbi:sigma 54-interacting transcriptional regulator [Natroniella sulfidigena]|uniref:sigma 54-interacting transcriptional regulator n=1 Tax=Natroniella sulfidigena TaxID=723921 RepID=UPI00200A8909|nr:sigma 54-interacting transcriptional regulator [Natroniella sulfidigena]MCK8816624.1 sigma 54-interacting transcriptional regulator [Natroniella sulfidigena]